MEENSPGGHLTLSISLPRNLRGFLAADHRHQKGSSATGLAGLTMEYNLARVVDAINRSQLIHLYLTPTHQGKVNVTP